MSRCQKKVGADFPGLKHGAGAFNSHFFRFSACRDDAISAVCRGHADRTISQTGIELLFTACEKTVKINVKNNSSCYHSERSEESLLF